MLVHIKNEDEFKKYLGQKDKVFLVDFFAQWCGPCSMLAPLLEDLSLSKPDVDILKVDVDELPSLAQPYGVASIPALFVIKNNTVVNKHIGFCEKAALEDLVKV